MKKTIQRSLKLLSKRDKKVLSLIVLIQSALGLLDLIGVALIGIVGALSINGVQSKGPGNRVSSALRMLHLENFSFQRQVAILGFLAATFLVTRTLASVYFTRKSTFFLTRKSAYICGNLMSKLLSGDLQLIRRRTNQETLYAFSIGLVSITVGILASAINLVSDLSVLILIIIGLFVVDLSVAISTLLLFGAVGSLIYFLQQARARNLGHEYSRLNIKSEEDIVEVLNSFRELSVHDRKMQYAKRIQDTRLQISNVQAELNFMPQISKYVVESTVIVGALLICGLQFMRQDSTHAVAILSIFMASGSRIAPAVMRIQQGLVVMKTSLGSATPTLDLIDELSEVNVIEQTPGIPDFSYTSFQPRIEITNLLFNYPGNKVAAIKIDGLQIEPGQHVAIVGPSGAGKTTLVDLLLGVITPNSGKILVSGLEPNLAIKTWPGAISYVPQDVVIARGTLKENVALGYELVEIDENQIIAALGKAELTQLNHQLARENRNNMGEMGSGISGGQRQRVGIARALYTNPKLLVLDEATSSLDAETEKLISDRLSGRDNEMTLITIAHRLSTVRKADLVIYIKDGEIISYGTFEQVRQAVPNFDTQANLMGL
jgi:ATP-binding cassette subfamily C protein